MFLYWLLHRCIYSFLPFLHPVAPFVLLWSFTAMGCVYFLHLSLVNSTYWFFLLCLCNLYVLFQLIRNSGILLGCSVPSLSSVLPAPLKTFCCTHTPPFFLLWSPGFPWFFLSEKWSLCPCLTHIMSSCSHSVTHILAPFSDKIAHADPALFLDCLCLKFLPVCLLPLYHARSHQMYKEPTFSFSMSVFILLFPSLQAVSFSILSA